MYGQICEKKSRIDKVPAVKKFQDSSSDITFQICEQEAEATGTSESLKIMRLDLKAAMI